MGRAFACCVMPAHTGIKVVFLVEVLPCARNKDMGKDMGVCSVETVRERVRETVETKSE